jgi:hypothetical protein
MKREEWNHLAVLPTKPRNAARLAPIRGSRQPQIG